MVGSTEECCGSSGNADDVVELKEEGEEEESAPHSIVAVRERGMKMKIIIFSPHFSSVLKVGLRTTEKISGAWRKKKHSLLILNT